MKIQQIMDLPEDYSLVLQQIQEDGEDDFLSLVESLNIKRSRLIHVILSLAGKGMVAINQTNVYEIRIRLTRKGSQIVRYIWPESVVLC